MNTATLVQSDYVSNKANYRGDARLYKLSAPLAFEDYNGDTGETETKHTEYVLVSRADVMFSGPETYMFPADETGKVTDWGELPGSMRGNVSHEQVLLNAGYEMRE